MLRSAKNACPGPSMQCLGLVVISLLIAAWIVVAGLGRLRTAGESGPAMTSGLRPTMALQAGEPPVVIGDRFVSNDTVARRDFANTPAFTVVPISGHPGERSVRVCTPDLLLKDGPEGYAARILHGSNPMPPGTPDLPMLSRLFEGRAGCATRVEIVETSFRDISDIEIAPMPTRNIRYYPDDTFEHHDVLEEDPAIYSSDKFWPVDIAEVAEAWMGTQKVTRVSVHPVQYNPVTRTLRYHESIVARIYYEEQQAASLPAVQFSSVEVSAAPDPFECPPLYSKPLLPPMNGNPGDFALRRAGLEVDAIYKVTTTARGMHRLTQPELVAAGIPASSLVGSEIRMYCREQEILIAVSSDELFTSGDWVDFYAERFVGWYSGQNVYWLGFGAGGSGFRMAEIARPPIQGANEIKSYFKTVEYAPNTFHADNVAPNYEGWDHWRAAQLFSSPNPIFTVNDTFDVDFVLPGRIAKLCATLHGVAENPAFPGPGHNTEVDINGNNVTSNAFQWSGTGQNTGSQYSNTVTFSSSLLTSPSTAFYVRQELLPGNMKVDQVYLEALHLIYPRELRPEGDVIEFTGRSGNNNYEVDGFSGVFGLRLFDVTDAWNVRELTSFESPPTGNGFSLRFGDNSTAARCYVAVREASMRSVDSIVKTPVRDLGNADNQASYIVICPGSFQQDAFRLITNRYLRGESVVVAEPEDIYNNFSYGVKDANAVRQFLGYAFHHWSKPVPQRVLIAGDASFDPKGYVSSTDMDVVSALMGGTPFNFTALDVRAGMVNGTTRSGEADNLADMAIGRITARTSAELGAIVDKILAYERLPFSSAFRRRGLLVAGNELGVSLGFEDTADEVASMMLSRGFAQADIAKEYGASADNAAIVHALNGAQGLFACAYFGHGAHFFWDSPSLLSTTHAGSLSNSKLPVFTATTCWNGYYLHPDAVQECLAEVFLQLPDHGAIGFVAGTALSQDASASEIARGFYDGLLGQQVPTLGDAMMQGYLRAFSMGFDTARELQFYQIIGDPGLCVNP